MPKKPKLLIEGGALAEKNMSGIGHTTAALVKALAARDEFAITIIVAFNKVDVVKANIPAGCSIKRIYLPGRIINGLTRFNLLPWMDLVFGKGVYLFPNFKNWPLLRSPSVTYVHDVYFKVAPEHIEPRNRDLLERNLGRFIKRSTAVVTVSNHAKTEIEQYFPVSRGKVSVVYNAIDRASYCPRPLDEQRRAAEKYGLQPKRYFMFLSNLEPRKNASVMLDAFREYVDRTGMTQTALLLVGGMSWGSEAITEKIGALQQQGYNVIKPGKYVPDDEIPALLSGALALVHPAVYEGFGIPPLEAMACGTPVIVGDNSSLSEVMGKDFHAYVDVHDAAAIARAMIDVRNDPKPLTEYGLARAAAFDWSQSAAQLSSIIKEVIT